MEKNSTRTKMQLAKYNGTECQGNDTRIEKCNTIVCPGTLQFDRNILISVYFVTRKKHNFHKSIVDCEWSQYTEWSDCSKSCGGGTRISNRTIIKNAVAGGHECIGESLKIEPCNDQLCPGIVKAKSY